MCCGDRQAFWDKLARQVEKMFEYSLHLIRESRIGKIWAFHLTSNPIDAVAEIQILHKWRLHRRLDHP